MYPVYASQLQLDLYKSRICYFYLSFIFIFVISSLLLLPLSIYIESAILLFVAALCFRCIKQRNKLVSISWLRDNQWRIFSDQGVGYEARLLDSSFISRYLCVLNFKLETGTCFSYTIFPDSIHHEQMRRLMVRMKIEGQRLFSQ